MGNGEKENKYIKKNKDRLLADDRAADDKSRDLWKAKQVITRVKCFRNEKTLDRKRESE